MFNGSFTSFFSNDLSAAVILNRLGTNLLTQVANPKNLSTVPMLFRMS